MAPGSNAAADSATTNSNSNNNNKRSSAALGNDNDNENHDVDNGGGGDSNSMIVQHSTAAAAGSSTTTTTTATATTTATKKAKNNGKNNKKMTGSSASHHDSGAGMSSTSGRNSGKNNNNNNTTTSTTTTTILSKIEQEKETRKLLHAQVGYIPLSLVDVQTRLMEIIQKVPPVPNDGFVLVRATDETTTTTTTTTTTGTPPVVPVPAQPCGYDKVAVKAWAVAMTYVIEEVSYLLPNVSVATYQWGTNRSGAADQNLQLLLTEIARSQDQINNKVSPRLNDILCPVVTLLTDKTITTKTTTTTTTSLSSSSSSSPPPHGRHRSSSRSRNMNNNIKSGDGHDDGHDDGDDNNNNNNNTMVDTETKQNYFIHTYEDTEYVELCYASVGRNAPAMRHLLLANLDKIVSALHDYTTADGKDKDSSRDFVY